MKAPRKATQDNKKRRARTPALLTLPDVKTPTPQEWAKLSPLGIKGSKGLKGLMELSLPKKPKI